MVADLHVHSICSADGRSTLDELCTQAAALGIAALAISDHDACTDVSGSYPVALIPSVEVTSTNGHVLGLFLDSPLEQSLWAQTPSPADAIVEIRRHGGIAVLAHPFAPQKLTEDEVAALQFDAIECENARAATKSRLYNHKARALAEKLGLPMLGGSDAHCAQELGGCITELDCENATFAEMKEAILRGQCRPRFVHACRKKYKGLSQWQKYRHDSLIERLRAFLYLTYCLISDRFGRK